jgi:PmbA protein
MNKMGKFASLFRGAGVAEYDIYTIRTTANEVQLRGFDIEAVREPINNVGYTVRVISREGVLVGIGASSCSSDLKLERCIQRAKSLSALNMQKIRYEFPSPKPLPQVETVDPSIKEDPVGAINELTGSVMSQLRDKPRADKSLKPTFGKFRTYFMETSIENSAGLDISKTETYLYLELALKVSDGTRIAEFWPRKFRRRMADLNPEQEIPRWKELAYDSLDAEGAPNGKMPVILNPESLCDALVPTVGFHCAGDQKFKSQSVFREGDIVASDGVTIIDDGLLDFGLVSSPFDDEGNPQSRTSIIEKGVFKNYIYDQHYAMELGKSPTGNGLKPFGMMSNPLNKDMAPVVTAPTNLSLRPGSISLDSMIEDVKEGVLIDQFSWLNPDRYSSSFSSEIRNGHLIKGGELRQPIKGGMVSGKMFDLIKKVSCVSDKAYLESGASAFSMLTPYIMFEDVQVVGR